MFLLLFVANRIIQPNMFPAYFRGLVVINIAGLCLATFTEKWLRPIRDQGPGWVPSPPCKKVANMISLIKGCQYCQHQLLKTNHTLKACESISFKELRPSKTHFLTM